MRPSPDLSYSCVHYFINKLSLNICNRPPRSGLRDERDKLLQENDDLRTRCERMMEQVADLTSKLVRLKYVNQAICCWRTAPTGRSERRAWRRAREIIAWWNSRRGFEGQSNGRSKRNWKIKSRPVRLVAFFKNGDWCPSRLKAEENLVKAEEDLEKQTTNVSELTKQVCSDTSSYGYCAILTHNRLNSTKPKLLKLASWKTNWMSKFF